MVGSWYRTYATKNAVWILMIPFFVFVLQRKMQGSCMSKHENKWYAKNMLDADAWWWNDLCKMHCMNMVNEKCKNNMSIMMPWRDAYAVHDMNAFTEPRARKIISSCLCIWGRSAPCVQLRRWFPACRVKRQDQHTTRAWLHDADAQKHYRGMYTAWQYPQNNHTAKAYMTFRLYAWQWLIENKTCSVFASCPYFGNLNGRS